MTVATATPPPAEFSPGSRIAVLLPLPLAGAYEYRVGAEPVVAGAFVRVPLGRREAVGVVWGPGPGAVDEARLRPILGPLPAVPPLPAELRALTDWVAAYTLAPPGAVLKMAMSVPAALQPPRLPPRLRAVAPPPAGLKASPARARVLAQLEQMPPASAADLARAAGVGPLVVRGLFAARALEPLPDPPEPDPPRPDPARPGPALSPAQAAAAAELRAALGAGFSVTLLDGVTGSGKTEVYFEAVAAALAAGRQVLVLLPEIALSAQWLERFTRRFGCPPLVWHSEVGEARRRDTWRAVARGAAGVVVGARSALFLPFPALGLIVVDEEHDGAFKQEDGVCYHARDMAVVRGRLGGFPVLLASATPALETMANVQAGRYRRLALPDRHAGAALPRIVAVDLRRAPPPRGRWLGPDLEAALAETLAAGEQAMLYLNRRGYAPLTLCKKCGFRLRCPHCSAWLVEHRRRGRLLCHHCGHAITRPDTCPDCGSEEGFAACGPGVERVAEEAAFLFPQARLAVMTSDTCAGPAAAAALVEAMAERRLDLLVGTQIVAKGYHFPHLTLVGVVDADLGLDGGDLRAAERTFQLLSQVAGRAGRAERPGRVLLQSWQPDHPVMRALVAGDRDGFLAREAASRREAGMPPYGRLAALILSGEDEAALDGFAARLARAAPLRDGIDLLGPAPAPLALLRGRHRRRFLVKATRAVALQAWLRDWLGRAAPPAGIRVQVDVDPTGFQ
ncbi:primosomal protein N' [Phaeospirillum tilakii]|uniref:Replication restart protein PriA n=1 Tax=Phaeospirillum tilakii TaxID=741673 RepID=A0ABW5CCF5_9PROT